MREAHAIMIEDVRCIAMHTDQILVRVRVVRILVRHLHVRMRRRAAGREVKLLYVLAVIAFRIRQPEEPFLDDRIVPVPERERYASVEGIVAESGGAVLTPAVHATARMIVWKMVPRGAVFAVVFAYSAPLPLAQIRSPVAPS
jgi:hypothetical protein